MAPKLNDEEVIRKYLTTNPNDCFETLYKRYVGKVYNRCLSLTKDSAKAQDFTHDIFIKMFSRLDRFEERSTFSTWLYSISYNYCMDQLRIGKRMFMSRLEEEVDGEKNQYASPEELDDMEHTTQLLNEAMNKISPEEAMILRLKYEEGCDLREIASLLNLKDSAVKMRLKRSRDKVKLYYDRAIAASTNKR